MQMELPLEEQVEEPVLLGTKDILAVGKLRLPRFVNKVVDRSARHLSQRRGGCPRIRPYAAVVRRFRAMT